ARDLAAEAAGAAFGDELEDLRGRGGDRRRHRFFFPCGFPGRSRRPMNSSSGMAAIVIPATPPRAPSSTDTREIVALSGASTTVTKSYGPSTAYCATTRAPIRSTSALTLRIHPGRSRSTLRPDSDSVLSITYTPTGSLLAVGVSTRAARLGL